MNVDNRSFWSFLKMPYLTVSVHRERKDKKPFLHWPKLKFHEVAHNLQITDAVTRHTLRLPLFEGLNFHDQKVLRTVIEYANIGNDSTVSTLTRYIVTMKRSQITESVRKLANKGFLEIKKIHGYESALTPLKDEYGREWNPPLLRAAE